MVTTATRKPYGDITINHRPPQVYIAASWSDAQLGRVFRHILAGLGIGCTSRWLDLEQTRAYGDLPAESVREDLADINAADALVVFSHRAAMGHGGKGGRWIETGYAMHAGKPILYVATPPHIFHHFQGATVIPAHRTDFYGDSDTETTRNVLRRVALDVVNALDKLGWRA